MRLLRIALVALMALGLVVTSAGWYLSASAGADEPFEDCHFEDGTLVLTFTYGANAAVAPRVDTRGRDIVVSLVSESGSGPTPAIGLSGEARFGIFGQPRSVRYPDGTPLSCPRRA